MKSSRSFRTFYSFEKIITSDYFTYSVYDCTSHRCFAFFLIFNACKKSVKLKIDISSHFRFNFLMMVSDDEGMLI